MTMDDIVNLDCRKEGNNEIIQKYLKKIKPLAKYKGIENVPIYKIEKVIVVLSKKYNVRVREFAPDFWSNDEEVIWRAILVDDRDLKQVDIVFGLSLYEVVAKTAIYMYSLRNKVGERQGGK